MKIKHFIFALVAMLMCSVSSVFADNVAKIGDTEYAKLEAAMTEANKAAGNYTITLLDNSAEVFAFAQKSGVNITIDGEGNTFSGKITLSAGKGSLTFTDAKIAPANSQTIYLSASTAPNVTFDGCTLQGANKSGTIIYGYASATSNALTVKNCTADNLQYIISHRQTGANSVLVENVTATNMIYLVRVLKCPSVTVKNVTVKDAAIGIEIKNDGAGGKLTLENVNINTVTYDGSVRVPVSGIGAGKSWTVELKGANQFSANGVAYEDLTWFSGNAGYNVVCAAKIGDNFFGSVAAAAEVAEAGQTIVLLADYTGDAITLPEGVKLDANGKDASKITVQVPNYVAQIGEQGYATLTEAFVAANVAAGDYTITLLADNAEEFTFAQNAGVNITVDGEGKTFTGKITLNAGAGNLTFTDMTLTPSNADAKSIVLNASTAPNVTIDGCTMKNTGTKGAIVWGQVSSTDNKVVIKNSTASNLQYLVATNQAGCEDVTVENVTATNMAYLIRPMKATKATVKNVTYSGLTFVQVKNSNACTLALENVKVTTTQAGLPPITMVAPDSGNGVMYTITLKGENFANGAEMTVANAADWFLRQNASNPYEVVDLNGLNGEGTAEAPYLINNVADLEKFRDSVNAGETKYNAPGVYVALGANIDLAGTDWSVNIGDDCSVTFDGIFDGKNHTIKNLTSTETAQKDDGYICTGLFGAIGGDAVVKDFTIENVNINTGDFTGNNAAAVVGFAYKATGSVENVTVTGNININANNVDGTGVIVGYSYGGNLTVNGCKVEGNNDSAVTGQAYVGGIIGYATKAVLSKNTVENIDINATSCSAAGIAGIMNNGGTATDNTVKNVDIVSTHENWKNAAAVVAGTITAPVTISGTVAQDVTANGVATTSNAGAVHANKPTTPVAKVEAMVNDVYYKTFAAAYAAAQAGETVTMLVDLTIAEPLVIGKSIVIEGEGHTLTYTGSGASARAITVENDANGANLTIKNLTIDCTASYCQRGINYNTNGKLVLDGVTVKGTNVTYALNLPGSSVGAQVTINNSRLTANIALNVWGANAVINATDSHFTSVDNSTSEGYTAIALNNDGSTVADGTTVTINRGSITAKDENGELSNAIRNSTSTGVVNVSDDTAVTGHYTKPVAIVDYGTDQFYSCATLQAAIDKAIATNGTVKLIADVKGAGAVINGSVTIDFNGKAYSLTEGVGSTGTPSNGLQILKGNTVTLKNGTLNVDAEAAGKFYILVQNYANLTVENMNLDGTNLDKWVATDGDSYVLSNNSGTVNVIGSTIKQNNDGALSFAIDACLKAPYEAPIVTVAEGSTIDGNAEVSATLNMNGTLNGAIVLNAATGVVNGAEGLDVTTNVACHEVVVENGKYSVAKKERAGHVAYRPDVTDKEDREGIAILLKEVVAEESLVVEVYHNDTKMFTCTRREIDDEGKAMFPVDGKNTTANIVLWGRESGSWINEIHVGPTELNVPNIIKVYADGVLTDTYTNESGTVLGVNLEKYLALDCVKKAVAIVGDVKYATLAEAVAVGGEVTLLADVNENVTLAKSVTINGANNKYTGTMTINNVTATIQNVAFVKGQVYKHKSTGSAAVITIKDCTFDGEGLNAYAVNVGNGTSLVIENVTAKNYGYGLLQVPSSFSAISVKDVEVSEMYYGFKVDYAGAVAFENVTVADDVTIGIYDSNYGDKTYTIKNSEISSISIWERSAAKTTTFKFEGLNKVTSFTTSQYAKVDAEAKSSNNYYGDLAAVVAATQDGVTVELLADVTLEGGNEMDAEAGLVIDKAITFEGNGHTIDCGTFVKGIRIYGHSNLTDIKINNVTVVNNNANGRCVDTRAGLLRLKFSKAKLIATNGNSQPLTVGGSEKLHQIDLSECTVDAGNSGYAIISFVPTSQAIKIMNSTITGYAGVYLKGDGTKVTITTQSKVIGKNVHSGASNGFGAVVIEGNNNVVNVNATKPLLKAVAEGGANQAAVLVKSGTGNKIVLDTDKGANIVAEGENAYWAMVNEAAEATITKDDVEVAPVAQFGKYEFTSLEEALRMAKNGGEVKLLADIALDTKTLVTDCDGYSSIINVEGMELTFDLNGHTMTVDAAAADLADAKSQFLLAVFSVDKGGKLTINDSSEAKTGAVIVNANDATVYSVVTNYTEGAYTTINGGKFVADKVGDSMIYSGSDNAVKVYGGTFLLGNTGTGSNGKPWIFNGYGQNGTNIEVYGGTFNTDVNHQYWAFEVEIPSTLAVKSNGDGTWTVVPAAASILEKYNTKYNRTVGYATIEEAIAALPKSKDGIVTIVNDVTVENPITVAADETVVLDLNGKTISATENATGSYALITNRGNLTINGEGAITLTATNNRGWNAYSSVISNTVGGNLTVNGGTIQHCGGTDMAYGIDNLTNGKGTYAETIINGGEIISTYRAVRQFLNGVEAQNILTINGGTIEGANKSIFFHDPSTKANNGTLYVAEDATLMGDVYLFVTAGSTEWPVEVYVAKAAMDGESTVLSANVPEAAALVEYDTFWQVEQKNIAELTIVDEDYAEYINKVEKTVGKLTYVRTFETTEWQTIYLPFEVPVEALTAAGLEAAYIYNASYKDGAATIDHVVMEEGSLAANYPYFVRATEVGTKSVVVENATLTVTNGDYKPIDCSSVFEKFTFTGTYDAVDADDLDGNNGHFVKENAAWETMDEVYAFRVYLTIELRNGNAFVNPQAIRMRSVDHSGKTTGVDSVDADQAGEFIFDLQGRRVAEPEKGGIYIINGQKVLVK